jgi:hypothetical protein
MANNGPKSLTSDDVNYLIYRYLQESGQGGSCLQRHPCVMHST